MDKPSLFPTFALLKAKSRVAPGLTYDFLLMTQFLCTKKR